LGRSLYSHTGRVVVVSINLVDMIILPHDQFLNNIDDACMVNSKTINLEKLRVKTMDELQSFQTF
jgi:hypothetical protein